MKILVDLDLLKDISYTLTMYGIPYPLLDEIIADKAIKKHEANRIVSQSLHSTEHPEPQGLP
jgi:hypothetical protein